MPTPILGERVNSPGNGEDREIKSIQEFHQRVDAAVAEFKEAIRQLREKDTSNTDMSQEAFHFLFIQRDMVWTATEVFLRDYRK